MISYYHRPNGSKQLEKIFHYEKGSWISVVNPNQEEIGPLVQEYKVDKDLIIDGLDDHELPRMELEGKRTYLFVKALMGETKVLGTILMVFDKKLFLTISKEEPAFFKLLFNGKNTIDTSRELYSILRLLNLINQDLERTIVDIVKNVQRQRKVTLRLEEKTMLQLLHQEDFLNNLVSTYYYTNFLYPKMTKYLTLTETERIELKDLTVQTNQGLNLCRTSLKKISNLRDHYNIILSTKLNRKLKVLMIFTILISIPAAISSLYGMNILLPFQNDPLAFLYIGILITLSWIGFFYIMKRIDVV